MGEGKHDFHTKKVENMKIFGHLLAYCCYIYLLSVFWGFGSFTVLDIP